MSYPITITAGRLADAIENRADAIRAFALQQPEAVLGQCQSDRCRAPIWWGVLTGRPHPFDLDGVSHFATCPDADAWRQRAQQKELAARQQTNLFDAIADAKRDREPEGDTK